MKIITAIDSMKGSLSSIQANNVIEQVFSSQDISVKKIAIADGGEGTVEAFIENYGGSYQKANVHNLIGEEMQATFGWIEEEKLAIIESADTSGIQFLDGTVATHPSNTNSRGVGETILAALDLGAKKIIVGLGGTATIDGGIGALNALGVEFLDNNHKNIEPFGENLSKIQEVNSTNIDQRLNDIELIIASDVTSHLTGTKGAVYMFGTQKGLMKSELDEYEESLKSFQDRVLLGQSTEAGDGAAGGLGLGLRTLLKGKIVSGFSLLVEYSTLIEELNGADLVITGEGKIDDQSLQGKVPVGISRLAKENKIPVIAFVGSVEGNPKSFKKQGLNVVIPIVDKIMSIDQAMKNAKENLTRVAERTKDILFILVDSIN